MKRYGKRTTKLLQIRLSREEHQEVVGLLRKLNITRRQLILDLLKRKDNYAPKKLHN